MRKTVGVCLLFITILGFYLRLHGITESVVDQPIRGDAREYFFYAYNMKYHHVYSHEFPNIEKLQPDAVRSPGYPVFLSIFLDKNFSELSLKNILFAQIMLSTLTILFAYFLSVTLLESYVMPLAVALAVAISPHLINMNIYFLSETLFCFLIVTAFFMLSRPQFQASSIISFCFGLLLASAALTRPWLNYFIIVLAVFWFFTKTLKKRLILQCISGFLALMSLWTIRNLMTLGIASDSSLTLGTLHHGLYPYFMYDYQPQSYGYPYRFDPRSSEIAASIGSILNEIIRRFKESPWEYVSWYVIGKPIELFSWNNYAQGMGDVFIYPTINSPYFYNGLFKSTHQIMKLIHPVIIALFVFSLFAVWMPLRKLGISSASIFIGRCMALLCIYFILVHSLGAPFPRYSIPILPLMYGMAFFSVAILIKFISLKINFIPFRLVQSQDSL